MLPLKTLEVLGDHQVLEQTGRAEGPTSAESMRLERVVHGCVGLAGTRYGLHLQRDDL